MPLSAATFREIVSGRRRGLLAAVARGALAVLEIPYRAVVTRRNRRYDIGRAEVHRVGVPVVSVGNITLGGTGKTPLVAWLARWFDARGLKVAIVSRGYKAEPGQTSDESRELAELAPRAARVQNADRVAAAQAAIAEHHAQLILADDAFQHRRLARNLDIVLVDALAPLGYGRVFPRGMLREPLDGLGRAQIIALSRADLVSDAERAAIRQEIERHAPRATWIELRHAPRTLVSSSGEERPIASLAGAPVAAFCGVGNPEGFRKLLEAAGYRAIAWREFPDHFAYPPAALEELSAWAARLDVAAIVCTRKDLVKIPRDALGGKPLWALAIDVEITAGLEALEAILSVVSGL